MTFLISTVGVTFASFITHCRYFLPKLLNVVFSLHALKIARIITNVINGSFMFVSLIISCVVGGSNSYVAVHVK